MRIFRTIAAVLCASLLLSGCSSSNLNEQLNIKSEKENQRIIALYHGIPIDINDRDINIFGQENNTNRQISKNYEKEHFLYSNNEIKQKADGKIVERGLDYYWQVRFLGDPEYEVALSQSYNPYPRKPDSITSEYPENFGKDGQVTQAINEYFKVKAITTQLKSIDLDGDGQKEFLTLVVDKESNFFAKVLVDANFNIVSYLTVFKEETANFEQVVKDYGLDNSGEIIDIDNDGNMELVMSLPSYEGFLFKVFRYQDGTFNGEYVNNVTLKP